MMTTPVLTLHAPAKLNLTLTITARRGDGYHLLDSLFVFCDLNDRLTVKPSKTLEFATPTGPFADNIEHDNNNLVMRAAATLQNAAGVQDGALITLDKVIPVAAGLGGGSADAAATLLALNQFWNIQWPLERLHELATILGADVPACLVSTPVFARGIGDILSQAPALPDCGILLVNPRITAPTPAVFKAFKLMHPEISPKKLATFPDHLPDLATLVEAMRPRGNDLQEAAVSVAPVISDVLTALGALPGVAYCAMSGSGATCFALFETSACAATSQRILSNMHPNWWAWNGSWAARLAAT